MSTALVLIDWQERLFPAMPETIRDRNLKQATTLTWFARELSFPILCTEQYPKGLGHSLSEFGDLEAIEKIHFSAVKEPAFIDTLKEVMPERVVLSGMETHICVAQTCLDLCALGIDVTVIVDAVLSRRKLDWEMGLRQMEAFGAELMTTEMFLFEQLGQAGSSLFKEVSKRIR